MKLQKYKDFISKINTFIISFENQKIENQKEIKNVGVVYTPKEITEFIIENIFKIYFEDLYKINIIKEGTIDYTHLIPLLNQNDNNKENFFNNLKRIKILDPSCGSGRFLISAANFVYNLWRTIDPNSDTFQLKKEIIQNNLYGIDIDEFTCQISRLRLFEWLISENDEFFNNNQDKLESLNFENLSAFFKKLDTNFNIFHTDYLLKFSSKEKFDVIIGNPPYIENKKISNRELKKELYKKFKSAYKLFDLSILFLEKSLELLNDNCGYLSFLITNKFLSADYGIKIREILIRNSEIKELVNTSSLKLFNRTAAYPIIIFLKKGYLNSSNSILIKNYTSSNEFFAKESNPNLNVLSQSLLEILPAHVIPVKGNIKLVSYLYSNFNTLENAIEDLKIIYRPYGFLKWMKFFDNVVEVSESDKDLILLGTGNVGRYYVNFEKQIQIAQKKLKVSFFKYEHNFEEIWQDLQGQKLIFREIAKNISCVYDPGNFTNITGLYFIKIPSFNTNDLFCLLTILNSDLIDSVFKTLFSSLHMSGGYIRFNGSFIKRLPIPDHFPNSLSKIGKILQFLSQFLYEVKNCSLSYHFEDANILNIKKNCNFLRKTGNSLINLLFLKNYYQSNSQTFPNLEDLLVSNGFFPEIEVKYILPRFKLTSYNIFQLKSIISEINELSLKLKENNKLLDEINSITQF